jgi:carboxyl-terminal processing protease
MNPKMTKIVARILAIILIAALVITSFSFVFFLATGDGAVYGATTKERLFLDKELDFLEELMIDVKSNYKDDISYEELVEGAYQGIFEALGDPYSVYYSTDEESDNFVESVSGEFSGVGVSMEDVDGKCRVVAPIPGTPADKAGIQAGDVITKVDGVDVFEMNLDSIVGRIKGEAGTKVTLTIDRNGLTLTFTLTREVIKTSSVSFRMVEPTIGYIQIAQFDNDSHVEFRNAKLQLISQGAKSLVVDVRNNPGGFTKVAADIANQLMPKGPITHYEQRGTIVETVSSTGEGDLGIPVILLVNEGSASASEILAGAWQDSETAILVGTTTFGKGVAQQLISLENGDQMKLSVFYFLTPDKQVIDKVGITPDYIVDTYKGAEKEALLDDLKSFAPMAEKEKPKAGDTGLNVFGAQQRLSLLGYGVAVTGTMDGKTVDAVKSFQKTQGLYSYGVLDYSTMGRLDTAAANFVLSADNEMDLQLEKAIELAK